MSRHIDEKRDTGLGLGAIAFSEMSADDLELSPPTTAGWAALLLDIARVAYGVRVLKRLGPPSEGMHARHARALATLRDGAIDDARLGQVGWQCAARSTIAGRPWTATAIDSEAEKLARGSRLSRRRPDRRARRLGRPAAVYDEAPAPFWWRWGHPYGALQRAEVHRHEADGTSRGRSRSRGRSARCDDGCDAACGLVPCGHASERPR